ncbi:hypothetical protein KW843_18615 [Acidovorax sp. sif1233]|uniref:hypothetical protein n=1 Tax=unclassified Acidovorax TaxID=2684926 RepID=UPI001C4732BB|nr:MULTISPECIES: hypothetical protein [unclassified Acidovorax]MBV7429499.1 hypothetical protein [Acidovorax sp. sif0732]MBV7448577.1 hypothetical protein [Acidovorax sp. sif0715]MBV7456501.1 hypothetical protein [Acidovorax sp. sif1233]
MRNPPLLLAALAAMLAASTASGQNLFKCTDDKGHTTFSDRACAQAPRPAAPPSPRPSPATAPVAKVKASAPSAPPAAPAASSPKAENITRLTPAVVEGVLRRAVELGDRSDYRAQCALAAPDLSFKLTDHSSSPASVYSGGRAEICALQQQSAQAMQASGLRSASRLGKLDIRVNADGTQATARSESAAAISAQGQHVLTMQCTREEVLGLYSGSVLYQRVTAVCRPS